jgi:hypothetical protein
MASALQRGDFRALQRIATSAPESTDVADGLDDYVRHFVAIEPVQDEPASPRLILPLARPGSGTTSVGLDVRSAADSAAPSGCGCRALVRRGEG